MIHRTWKSLVDTVNGDTEGFLTALKIETFSGVVRDTRVRDGFLRGDWQITKNSPATSPRGVPDKTGQMVINEIQISVDPYAVDILTNNLPYAAVWEERDGMIARNVARIDTIINRYT